MWSTSIGSPRHSNSGVASHSMKLFLVIFPSFHKITEILPEMKVDILFSCHFQQHHYINSYHHHHHHHKHQGLDLLIRSVSKVTPALYNVSSVFHLFSFLVVCSSMISKGFGFVAFFATVETSSVCTHLSCLACL